MAAEEGLKTKIQAFFETYGLDKAVQDIRTYEEAWERTKTAVTRAIADIDRDTRGISRRAPMWREQFAPQAEEVMRVGGRGMVQAYAGGGAELLPGGPLAAPGLFEEFKVGMRHVEALMGAVNNLVHVYYWWENAQLNLENAQNRLANAQDRYNQAVEESGAGSWQAIRAFRQMEVAENRLNRAHNRQILNIGLVGSQIVMMVGRIGSQLIPILTKETATVATQTLGYYKLGIMKAFSQHPLLGIAAVGIGAGLLTAAVLHGRAVARSEREAERRVAGLPSGDIGARIISPGLIRVQRDELVLTPEQQRMFGGRTVSLRMGDVTVNVSPSGVEGAIDDVLDRQRWNVKSQLRRFVV